MYTFDDAITHYVVRVQSSWKNLDKNCEVKNANS